MTPLVLRPLPKTMPPWEAREVERIRHRLSGDADVYEDEQGVLRWRVNQRVVASFVYDDAWADCPPVQASAYQAELDVFFAQYRSNPPRLTDEDAFEMRSAFGPGAQVMDVLTGQTWTV